MFSVWFTSAAFAAEEIDSLLRRYIMCDILYIMCDVVYNKHTHTRYIMCDIVYIMCDVVYKTWTHTNE